LSSLSPPHYGDIVALLYKKLDIGSQLSFSEDSVTALVENGGLWQWIIADNRRQFQTISDSITVLANCHRLPQIAVT